MKTDDFDYNLPEELIAQTPLKNRDHSRLLILDKNTGNITHETFNNILDYLNEEEKKYFTEVLEYLDQLEVNYEIDNSLVRGLDYYTNIVFEFTTSITELGSIGAGGRYNNLLSNLDGPEVPAVGFAFGLDRIVSTLDALQIDLNIDKRLDVYILTITEKQNMYALELAQNLRMCGYKVDLDLTNKIIMEVNIQLL